jgi:hypothetical protein
MQLISSFGPWSEIEILYLILLSKFQTFLIEAKEKKYFKCPVCSKMLINIIYKI